MSAPLPLRVVLVEDDARDAELIVRELRRGGFDPAWLRVQTEAALAEALDPAPDVVLTDYRLPQYDGLQAIAAVLRAAPDVPVILVTGALGDETAAECMRQGAADYVLKDRPGRLGAAVTRAIEQARLRRAHREAEAELRSLHARMEHLLAHSPATLYALRPGRPEAPQGLTPIFVSDSIQPLLGFSADEALREDWWVEHLHPEDREAMLAVAGQLLDRGGFTGEYRVRHRDGTYRWIEDHTRVLRDEAGRPTQVIGVWIDITARKALEAQLRQSQKLEAVGLLTGGIAHDFNNLLTAVLGHCELLLEELAPGNPLRADVEEIRRAGDSAARLTRQLLAFSRQQVLQPEVLDLNAVVVSAEKLLRRVIGEDVAFAIVLDPAAWPVRADAVQLEQVLVNLAVNARDAMAGGGTLTIETSNVRVARPPHGGTAVVPPGEYVALCVSDTGCGMTEEVRTRIFEPFFSTKERGHGTGLGLATVHGIVKQSGGHIDVISAPGAGTTVTIWLPRQESPRGAAASDRTPTGSVTGSERVLVVEDEQSIRLLLRTVLERAGYAVTVTGNADEAFLLAGMDTGFDLLVTDLGLPGLDGRRVAAQLVQRWPALKVLYISGYSGGAVRGRAPLDPREAFLEKPFTPQRLAHKVREVLNAV